MDGSTQCIELVEKNQKAILLELKTVPRIKNGFPFKRIKKLVGKLCHVAIGILTCKALFSLINPLMALKPTQLIWMRCPSVYEVLQDLRQLIREVSKKPTHVNKLVPGDPNYEGTLDASGEGAGGIWVSEVRYMAPII